MAARAKSGVENSLLNLLDLPRVEFASGQVALDTAQFDQVRRMADVINQAVARDPRVRIVIEGRADRQLGKLSPEENRMVAQRRAEAIVRALSGMGVADSVLVPIGVVEWGEEATASALAEARRPNFQVTFHEGGTTLAPSGESAPLAPGSLGASGILVGIGQGLVDEARAQLAEYMLSGAGQRICVQARVYLTRTCAWFEGSASRGYLPSVATLRSSLDADLAGVPLLLLEDHLLATLPPTPNLVAFRQRLGVLYLTHGMKRYLAGDTPLQIAQGLPAWIEGVTDSRRSVIPDGYAVRKAEIPEVVWISTVSSYVEKLEAGRELLSAYVSPEALSSDTVALYALRTLAVNDRHSGQRLTHLLHTGRTLMSVAAAADSIRRLLVEGAADSAGRALQRGRYEALLGTISSGMVVLAQGETRDGVSHAWGGVAERFTPHVLTLFSAAAVRDHREAMHGVTAILFELSRDLADPSAQACLREERRSLVRNPSAGEQREETRESCRFASPYRDLPPRTLALLSFVGDVAAAQTEQDVNHAVRGFVRQQGGARGKRFEGGTWYRSVNAYVGLQHLTEELQTGEPAGQDRTVTGAYLPVGFEVGLRAGRRAGRGRGLTAGVFLQAVDLGALALRRPAQEEDQVTSEVDWHRVVAPGVGLLLGLGEVPFSLGVIGSYAPAAREVRDVGDVDALRWGLVLGFDLPLLR